MNRKLAHAIAFFLDLLCLVGVWRGYSEFQRILFEIQTQADIIQFGNRVGFFVVALGFPMIHLLSLIDYLAPRLPEYYSKFINRCLLLMVFALLGFGFFGSFWIRASVEDAGYIYCRNASGISALSKTLVFAVDMNTCEEQVGNTVGTPLTY